MSRLEWDNIGERFYETGVDHGVLYLPNALGVYNMGYAWNGLTAVTESPSGAEANPQYADNIKYLNLTSAEEFGATIEAFTYPIEFEKCDGTAAPAPGIAVGQQRRSTFGFSYRTLVGNDLDGQDHAYKIHLVYGAQAAPSEKAYATVNDSPEALTFSWELTTNPVPISPEIIIDGRALRPTASLTFDSRQFTADKMKELEDILYGDSSNEPRLPTPYEAISLMTVEPTEVTPNAPTFDDTEWEITIPVVTGIAYQINNTTVTGVVEITEQTTVTAIAVSGYTIPTGATTTWTFDTV